MCGVIKMIKSFSCSNFRNVNVKNLKFSKINILIGPNNSGKTNFIKALSFCADMLSCSGKLVGDSAFQTLISKSGMGDIYNKYAEDTAQGISMRWNLELDEEKKVSYQFNFHTGNEMKDFFITRESLEDTCQRRNKKKPFNYFTCNERPGEGYISRAVNIGESNSRISFEIPKNDTILRQFDKIRLDNKKIYEESERQVGLIQKLEEYFGRYYFYSSSQFDLNKIREPQNIQNDGRVLDKDGSNFVNVLNYYKNQDLNNSSVYLEKLKELMPTLELADVMVEFNKLRYKLRYDGQLFNLSDLSDGTIKALILTLLIQIPVNEGLAMLAIDEPEMNIHPAWQQIIGRWIQRSDNFKQCFISTHSPDFLDVFTEGFKRGDVSVFVFDPREEHLVNKLDYKKMAEDLEEWELGDLYRVNDPAIGGWPW